MQQNFSFPLKTVESKNKAMINHSQTFQIVLFVCFISVAVPNHVEMNKEQMIEMLVKLDREQRGLRSEMEDIKRITKNEDIKDLDSAHLHGPRTRRDVQVNGTRCNVLGKILRKLSSLESRVNRAFSPYLRGPRGPKGEKGEKGEKGDKGIGGSTTFIRWGKTTCPNTQGTSKIYSGRIAGQHYTQTGGTSSQLCLHMNPRFVSNVGDTGQHIYGTEYENNRPFTKNIINHEAVCAVCLVNSRGSKLVVNGRNDCPAGWTLEYNGYLMSERHNHKGRTQAICVDVDADMAPGTHQNLNGNLLYTLQASCGSLPCAPYISGREITCAVCTK